ncbi:unnamed protein product [Vitrella brassicaformis CCMP3155]|uniref:Uncharacterized protein n=2 Tax=Vitrella brassicaformis TaxID=1169539 RepID=A0A0G4F4C6_VITBC|nr:unnamed protein product [Vitrella brassicaformis CCMP3155]|mmetsp:Transcript_16016/g.38231  ORF Transcript_16016/g.38231 Transcript_16016/m.38231 type:complete len:264 (+) Transcript_16016:118-909(+)|eukprot:CEM06728.1 unnamed protein product [Vitrella brassicaformis CCMP3155]
MAPPDTRTPPSTASGSTEQLDAAVKKDEAAAKPSGPLYGTDIADIRFGPTFGFKTTNQAINLHKAFVPVFIMLMMVAFNNYELPIVVYFVMHTCYALFWITIYSTFPFKNFEFELGNAEFWMTFTMANSYLSIAVALAWTTRELPPWRIGLALFSFMWGIFLNFVTDAQTYCMLKYRKGLITDGMYQRTRNPGYLGEVLIYAGYCMMAKSWVGWCVCLVWWLGVFVPNATKKDKSLSRYPGFEAYKAHTYAFLPKLTPFPALF